MTRKVEVFSAGCPCCEAVIEAVRAAACPHCSVAVRDMNDPTVAAAAQRLGVTRVPAVAIDGQLAGCCDSGVDMADLARRGLGAG